MFGNVKIFPTETLQQNIVIKDFKLFVAGENTSVLIILATTVLKIIFFSVVETHTHTKWLHSEIIL